MPITTPSNTKSFCVHFVFKVHICMAQRNYSPTCLWSMKN